MTNEAQQVWREIGKPECAQPTPEQLLQFMRLCDDADGLALAERVIQSSDDAHRCWLMGHDALLDEVTWLRRELAEARIKADAVDAWLKDDTCETTVDVDGTTEVAGL